MKKRSRTNALQIGFVYIGLIIGAGFASGQEIINFFGVYGKYGIWGLGLSGLLFSIAGWATLELAYVLKISGKRDFIQSIFGKHPGYFVNILSFVFMAILYCTMLSASGAIMEQGFGLPKIYGILLMTVLCFISFLFNLKGLVYINSIISPVLIIGGILFGLYHLVRPAPVFFNFSKIYNSISNKWILSALIYVSYNFVTGLKVLLEMDEKVDSKKTAKFAGIFGGVSMGLLGICVAVPLMLSDIGVWKLELPILGLLEKYGSLVRNIYIIILLSAIYATALGNGYALINTLKSKINLHETLIKFLFCFLAIFLALVGFSDFVTKVYPIFGFLGLFELIIILFCFIFRRWIKNE